MVTSPVQRRMHDFIEKYYRLNRVPVSDEMSYFVNQLAWELEDGVLSKGSLVDSAHSDETLSVKPPSELGVLSLPSGTECLTWVVPDKWTVHEAYIETLEGRLIADFHWHPIYLKAYSASFSGIVSRKQLLERISSHPTEADRLCYVNRWQYQLGKKKEWGFSLPSAIVQELKDEAYRVHIDTEFGQGTCDIVDWILPGEIPDTIFFSAHTCHPGQVNDGIACIALLIECFRFLQQLPSRKYTYRLIIGPEYYAAAGILQHGKHIPDLKYGLYLDMMGNSHPIRFSRSYDGDSYIDHVMRNVLQHSEPDYVEASYRGLYGNDEMFYDGPGFEIPTMGLSRYPFEHYHTELDDLEHCNFAKLEESLEVLKQIIDVFETDCIPARCYKGPLYLSKYDLYIDPKINQKGYSSLQEAQILINGKRTCLEIAQQIGVDFAFVRDFVSALCKHNLAIVSPLKSQIASTQKNEWRHVNEKLS